MAPPEIYLKIPKNPKRGFTNADALRLSTFKLSLYFHYLPATSEDKVVLPASEEGSIAIENT